MRQWIVSPMGAYRNQWNFRTSRNHCNQEINHIFLNSVCKIFRLNVQKLLNILFGLTIAFSFTYILVLRVFYLELYYLISCHKGIRSNFTTAFI